MSDIKEWANATLPSIDIDMEKVNKILNMGYAEFMSSEIDTLFSTLWLLRRYSFNLKKERNENLARSRWCWSTIMRIGKPLASEFPSYDKDERLQLAIKNHDYLSKVQDQRADFDSKSTILDGLEREIHYIIQLLDGILNLKISKLKLEKDERQ